MVEDKNEIEKVISMNRRKYTQESPGDYIDFKANIYQNPSSGALIGNNTPKYQLNYLPSSHYSYQSNVSINKVMQNNQVKIQMYAQDEASRESSIDINKLSSQNIEDPRVSQMLSNNNSKNRYLGIN